MEDKKGLGDRGGIEGRRGGKKGEKRREEGERRWEEGEKGEGRKYSTHKFKLMKTIKPC